MIHARTDYQRIQDPLGKIGEDEPVFLLRAQDDFFVPMLMFYVALNEPRDHDGRMIKMVQRIRWSIMDHVDLAREWRRTHKVKLPDMPEDAVREEES